MGGHRAAGRCARLDPGEVAEAAGVSRRELNRILRDPAPND